MKKLFTIIAEDDDRRENENQKGLKAVTEAKNGEKKQLFSSVSEEEYLRKKGDRSSCSEQEIMLSDNVVVPNMMMHQSQKDVEDGVVLPDMTNQALGIMTFAGIERPQSPLPSVFSSQNPKAGNKGCGIQGLEKSQKIHFDYQNVKFAYDAGGLYAYVAVNHCKYVGNFCIEILEERRIIEELVNEADEIVKQTQTASWKVKLATASSEFEGEIAGTEIQRLEWIGRVSYERATFEETPEGKRLIKMYLRKMIQAEQHQIIHEYKRPGWKFNREGSPYYLTSEGAIGFENLPVKASQGFSLITSGVTDFKIIINEFLGMRNIIPGNPGNAVFLQYIPMTALLTSFFKVSGFQIEFSTALIGKTNTKKTSCGEVFTKIFNRTKSAVPDINFSATDAAIFEIMNKGADQVILIDDLTPSENAMDAHNKRRKAEIIIRSYGDRVPRRRSVAFATNDSAKEFVPITGCALLTGEEFPCGKSSRARVVILRFEEDDVDDNVLSYFQNRLYVLPDLVKRFVIYLTNNHRKVFYMIRQECTRVRNVMKNIIKTPRYIDAYGVMCATSQIFADFLVTSGVKNYEEVQAMRVNDCEFMLRIIMQNDSDVSFISPGVTVIEALKDAIDKNMIQIKSIENWDESDCEKYVWYDEQFYYVHLGRLWECAKRYTDFRRIDFPYKSKKSVANLLDEELLLLKVKEGTEMRRTHKLVIGGKLYNARFAYLFREKVERIWKNEEEV